MNKWVFRVLYALLIGFIAFFIMLMASGCEILKTRKEVRNDSTNVKKTEVVRTDSSSSGSVKTENTKTKEDYEWFRLILQGMPRDTSVSITNVYPQPGGTIIYEGGKGSRQEDKSVQDSSWKMELMRFNAMMFDSLNRKMETIAVSKHSETKGVGLGLTILIILGAQILFKVLGWKLGHFKIINTKTEKS